MPVPPESFSCGIRYKDWIFVSGQMASDYEAGLAGDARGNEAVPLAGEGAFVREARSILARLGRVVEAGGATLSDVVRIDQFPVVRDVMESYQAVRGATIPAPRPSSQSVHIDGLLAPDANILVDLVALAPSGTTRIEAINSDKVPSPLGLYTAASKAGDYIFLAGQIATDWRNGLAPEVRGTAFHWGNNQIERETRYILHNIALTLEAAGSSLCNVVKAQVYLTDINDLPRVDKIWREAFPNDPPARTVYPVHSLGVSGTTIEITIVAVTDHGAVRKEVVHADRARRRVFHESQAIRAGDFLFLSGLMAGDAQGLAPAARVSPHYPYVKDTAAVQMQEIMQDAAALCEAGGTRLAKAVRHHLIHTDLGEYAATLTARNAVFPDGVPATSTLKIPSRLPIPGCTILSDLWIAT
jgi:enamine deaminase RidA (YjgF/YER057c/UK114 family)